ncbi:NADH-ubiquinone oxidoreductase assembly factor N7BML [Diplogelasinospora grovesii]|uniref:NADH-ubiquinone oxidoreductase assembly factor N7BML n=1 Tax=Diplogelasinospora grovesii TaxID=303347 RepID=A0AAN6N3G8_9PEZI|nr:NADH-ubiquinone oxidoreductase assembly factor N7BML [Diplogelasinospora grovesii]
MSGNLSPFAKAWLKWKSLRLPWRRQFLVGQDLHGNTYWEFRDPGAPIPPRSSASPGSPSTPPVRWRRIVKYPRSTHYGDVSVSPAWHQWLRHTRPDPPSITEQTAEVARQERMKVLAAAADARWAAKPSYIDAPGEVRGQNIPPLVGSSVRGQTGSETTTRDTQHSGLDRDKHDPSKTREQQSTSANAIRDAAGQEPDSSSTLRGQTWDKMMKEQKEQQQQRKGTDPWLNAQKQTGGPGEQWQPKAWNPPAPKR